MEPHEHIWLREGVPSWNARRKKVRFPPLLAGVNFFDYLPPDFREKPRSARYFEKIDLSYADIQNSDLSHLNFKGANFAKANLKGVNFSGSNLTDADLTGADLTGANLDRTILIEAKLISTHLQNASYVDAVFKGAILVGAGIPVQLSSQARDLGAVFFPLEETYRNAIRSSYKATARNSLIEYTELAIQGPQDKPEVEEKQHRKTRKVRYDVFYCTTRRAIRQRGELVDYGKVAGPAPEYGVCEVTIPAGKPIGRLGTPLWKRLFNFQPNRMNIAKIISLDESRFWIMMNSYRTAMKSPADPTIFVHGYNNRFKNAALRAAQIGYDLGLGQGIGLFSWPSRGSFRHYSADEAAAEASKYDLADFIEKFVTQSGFAKINIVAHSMGCRSALSAMEVLAVNRRHVLGSINQLILAAADIDTSVMPRLAQYAIQRGGRTTSYISDKDKALAVSGWLHDFPRVGIKPPTFILTGMDTVLVNNMNLGQFSHGYVGSSRAILNDIYNLIENNLPPDRRHGLEEVVDGPEMYWRIKD